MFLLTHVADICLANDILLMVSIRHNSANDKILVLCPIRERDDGRVPEDSILRLQRVWWYLRDVADNGRDSDVICEAVCLNGTLPKDLQSGDLNWL